MFYGVVEDRHDPLKIGRVRVRIHGYHTHDKQMISTPDLDIVCIADKVKSLDGSPHTK